MQAQAEFDTKPLLRPAQLADAKSELKALEAKINDKGIEDRGEAIKQFQRVSKTVADQTPRPPESAEEEGRMESRSRALLSEILEGMPSQEEMRKAPPGAVDKHMAWEKRNKSKILEWKNLRLRLTHGQEKDAANLERHRPKDSSLNMDNAYVPGKMFFMPPSNAGLPVLISDAEMAVLRAINPVLADMVGAMTNVQRREVKQAIDGIGLDEATPSPASVSGKKGVERREAKKRKLSEQHLAKLQAGRVAAREKALAAQKEI